jgi:thiamine kinase-like enzyme
MCHNDLNNLNILFESDQMHFIDYDYVGSNYLAYDIANFLNEATIDYSLPQYPGFTLLEPLTFEQIKSVAEIYPAYYSGLDLEVLKFMCVCNLYWAVWSIKRFPLNTSETFGVVEHGMLRLQLFQHYFSLIQK